MDKFDQTERVHLYACKRFLHVLDKTPNDIVMENSADIPYGSQAYRKA